MGVVKTGVCTHKQKGAVQAMPTMQGLQCKWTRLQRKSGPLSELPDFLSSSSLIPHHAVF